MPQPASSPESIETRDASCTNQQSTFSLGDQVCVVVSGSASLRRINLVDPSLFVVSQQSVTSETQTFVFTLPSAPTTVNSGVLVDNRGRWRVSKTNILDTSVVESAYFTVRDPQNLAVDVSVFNAGPEQGGAGQNIAYKVEVTNHGPDGASNVTLSNPVPASTTFVSASQTSGPAFTCTNPAANGGGTSTCTISALANGEVADFVFIYRIDSGATRGDQITSSPSVNSTGRVEVHAADNSFTSSTTISAPICTLNCRDDIVMNNDANQFGAIVNYGAPTTGDNGSCGTVSSSPESGGFFPVGTTTVVVLGSNGSPCSFDVTINDTQAPVIACPAPITVPEDAPNAGATINVPQPTVSDNDPTPNIVGVRDDGKALTEPFAVGTTTIHWTATDAAGHTDECDSTVNVTGDTSSCVLSCPGDVTVDAGTGSCGAPAIFEATASECGTDAVVYTANLGAGVVVVHSGDTFPVGTTTVNATVAGRSCRFRVIVRDTQAPTFSCPTPVSVTAPANSCEVVVPASQIAAPAVSDNCAGATINGVRSDGDPLNAPYPVGVTTITWTAKDASGNPTSCEQTVTVRDSTPPIVAVNVPNNLLDALLVGSANESCQTEIPDLTEFVVASDNCTPNQSLTILQTPAPGTLVGLGPHPITITVLDGDQEDPSAPPPNRTTVATINGVDRVVDEQNGTVQTIVRRTLNMVFTVNDTTPPTIQAPPNATYECASNVPTADPSQATAADNCSTPTITVVESSNNGIGSAANPLIITRVFTAKDGANLTASATQTITVIDSTPPTITPPLNVTVGTGPGATSCSAFVSDAQIGTATASDNCTVTVTRTGVPANNIFPKGTTTITWKATDGAGNTATATQTVTVNDTTPPVINLNGNTIALWPPNHKYQTVKVTDLVASATDNCDTTVNISRVVISKVTSDEIENGNGDGNTLNDIVIASDCKSVQLRSERDGDGDGRVYTITFKATDASGNVKTVTAKVTVPKNQNGSAAIDSGVHYTVNGNCP